MLSSFLTHVFADYLVLPILLTGGIVLLRVPAKDRYQVWARAVVAGLAALFFAKAMSLLYQQGQRPFEQLGVDPGAAFLPNPGFPSDHALLVFIVTFIVWAVTKNMTLSLILLAASTAVSVARVIALVHTPADVIGGFACAFLAVMCVYGRQFFVLRR